MKPTKVIVKRLSEVRLPRKHTPGASGFDLEAASDCEIPAHGFATILTGLAIEMPEGIEAQVRPRSGLAAGKGLGVLNSPGTIDADYRGEIKVVMFNMSGCSHTVRAGERIAQLVFRHTVQVELEESQNLSDTARGDGGFGHTG